MFPLCSVGSAAKKQRNRPIISRFLCYEFDASVSEELPKNGGRIVLPCKRGVMHMNYVTYEALFAFVVMLCAVISLFQRKR